MDMILQGRVSRDTAANPRDLRVLKKALNRLAYYFPDSETGIIGEADSDLFSALKDFQRDHGLVADGIVTPMGKTAREVKRILDEQEGKGGMYVWQSVGDDKVRPSHAAYDGETRSWDDAPDPGEDPNCRCWAEPAEKPGEERILTNASNIELKRLIYRHEGNEPQFYLDHLGNPTIGVGMMIPNVEAAQKLPFYKLDKDGGVTNIRANNNEIAEAYDTVKKQKYGDKFPARYYRKFTSVALKQEDRDRLLSQKLIVFRDELRIKFPEFDTYPRPAQIAIMDMQLNMGDDKFNAKYTVNGVEKSGWPNLIPAIHSGDWRRSASESHRKDVNELRNKDTRSLFLRAQKEGNKND